MRDRHFQALCGRDAWLDASFGQIVSEAIAVVTAIADQVASGGLRSCGHSSDLR